MRRSSKKVVAARGPTRSGGSAASLWTAFASALEARDGLAGAQAIHELWMRGEIGSNVERALSSCGPPRRRASPTGCRCVTCTGCRLHTKSVHASFHRDADRSNIYLVLLDYSDSRRDPFGLYVGMSHYSPVQRFEQHKAGIRAAGSVLQRGLEVLTGPTLHLQGIPRTDAVRIEEELAEALRAEGLFVQGGH